MRMRMMFVFLMLMGMPVIVSAMIAVLVFVLFVRVSRSFMNAKFHALDIVPLLTLEVHVKIAEIKLRQFPFESGRFHAEIDQCADSHVTADAGTAIEIEDFHRMLRVEIRGLARSLWCRGDN